jgi:uncharacterized OB-fold protein
MKSIRLVPVAIGSHIVGIPDEEGKMALCECGSNAFKVWEIKGDNHIHLECDKCGESYCPAGGTCSRTQMRRIT